MCKMQIFQIKSHIVFFKSRLKFRHQTKYLLHPFFKRVEGQKVAHPFEAGYSHPKTKSVSRVAQEISIMESGYANLNELFVLENIWLMPSKNSMLNFLRHTFKFFVLVTTNIVLGSRSDRSHESHTKYHNYKIFINCLSEYVPIDYR